MNWTTFVAALDAAETLALGKALKSMEHTLLTGQETEDWRNKDKFSAIKNFRARTGAGLLETKLLFERILGK